MKGTIFFEKMINLTAYAVVVFAMPYIFYELYRIMAFVVGREVEISH